MAEIPHFPFPFVRGPNGHIPEIEQDTDDHIEACVNNILRCPEGFREVRPDFGWPMPTFSPAPIMVGSLVAKLKQLEPRADIDAEEWGDEINAAIRNIEVRWSHGG